MTDVMGFAWLAGILLLLCLLLIAAVAVLIIVALVQIAKSQELDNSSRPMWVLVVLAAPLIGAIIWFASGPRGQRRSGPA